MKVEAAIAMLQSIPAGSEVDLQIRRIVTPDQAARPRRTSADRMRELRARRNGSSAPPASQPVTSVTNVTPSDASDGAERHGGTQGGSDPDQTEKSGKETGTTGSHLSGKGGARGESDAASDESDASHPASPSQPKPTRKRRAPKAPEATMPDDFALTDAHRKYADSKGWPWWWVENRFERYCSLARSKGMRFVDWTQALYTHLRGEISYQRGPEELKHLAPKATGPASQPFLAAQEAERQRRHTEALKAQGAPTQRSLKELLSGVGGDG